MTRRRATFVLAAAIGVVVALLAARTTLGLWRFATAAPELPLWDEAKYGLDGARLAAAIADLDLPRFATLVYGMEVWPPVFPLAESAVFLAAGNGFGVARGLAAVLFMALVLATFWAGREIAPTSPAVAALGAALVVTSPFTHLFAVQAMLELPGMLLYALALAAYARYLRGAVRGWLVATALSSAALFFIKYNYGLLWIAALLLNEAWIACGGARAALDRAVALARRVDWRRRFTVFVALSLAALVAIAVSGGGTLRLGSAAVSVTTIGNPLLVLIAIVVARAAWRPRRAWRRWREWERALSDRYRVLLWTLGAPAVVWLLLPPHLRSFFDFVGNRSAGPELTSVAGLLFYPRVFVEQYHEQAWIGVVAGVAVVSALARIGVAAPGARAVLLGVAVAVTAMTLHPYKEPRFLLIAAPALWLAAAWNVVTLTEAALGRARIPRSWTNGALALGALAAVALGPATSPALAASFARYTASAETRAVIDRVVEFAVLRPTLVLGTWNQASPALVEWRFRQLHAKDGKGTLPELVVPSRRGGAAEQVLRELRGARAPEQVVLLDVDPATAPSPEWAAAFAAEIAWLEPLRRDLEGGALPYQPVRDEGFAAPGYRLEVYRLSGASSGS